MTLADLEPATFNARRMDERTAEKLSESLDRYGMVEPIVVNERKGGVLRIVGGHQRVAALMRSGVKECSATVLKLTDEMERRLLLRLNRNTGRWDWSRLAEMDEDELLEAGFSEVEMARHGVGTGGVELEVEHATGDKAMTVRLDFATEEEMAAAMRHYVGNGTEERTAAFVAAARKGRVKA